MKKIILLLLAFISQTTVEAQTHVKDSLKVLLKKEKQDTSRVLLLAVLSSKYTNNKPDSAMILALEGYSLAKHIGFIKGEAASLNQIGSAYGVIGNRPKAMEVLLQAFKLNEKINNHEGMSRSLSGIGSIYNGQGEHHQAIDYYLKSKQLSEKINDEERIASSLRGIGFSYFLLKKYDSARLYTQQAYEISNRINSNTGDGNYFSRMGAIYFATGQKNLALEYYRQSIPYLKASENDRELGVTFLNMANYFRNEGQMDSTLFYAKKAFEISKTKGFTRQISSASRFLYTFYKKRGNADSALFYIELATLATDSLISNKKIDQIQSLGIGEKIRQKEIAEDRKQNLQYSAIAIGLICFIISFFALSRSIIVKTKFIEFFSVLGLLAVFEFINLFIHPYLAHATNDSPVLMLLVLIVIGAMLVPLHHKLEKWITKIMVEKNKKIRLDAAKKTIASLEPN